ncbi:MAG TPA: prolipoprotein diacylglyceryl transferase [Coxiellaceae bacterium]|nr:prolipoprotein diacylglyceryl transferase [Coxiellaceae bacterium]
MIEYPQFNPVAFQVGPLKVHWYGLMYLVGFVAAWLLGTWRAKRPNSGWTQEQVSDLIFYGAMGAVLGGRLGYVIFYNFSFYLHSPIDIVKIWDGGMSFHGGLIGAIIAFVFFARHTHKNFFTVLDFVGPLVPPGLAAGRLGNFINGELWGRITDRPWGMVFPSGGLAPRHPSQLYECFLEGIVLFVVLWWFSAKPKPRGAVTGLFLVVYAMFRFLVEFVRQPDAQLGFVAWGWMTQGQWLSLPMGVLGVIVLVWAYHHKEML